MSLILTNHPNVVYCISGRGLQLLYVLQPASPPADSFNAMTEAKAVKDMLKRGILGRGSSDGLIWCGRVFTAAVLCIRRFGSKLPMVPKTVLLAPRERQMCGKHEHLKSGRA